MHRIDTATKAVNLHGPGKHGFKDGNPLTGDPSTTLNASFFNSVQEEVAAVIEDLGGVLDGSSNKQMSNVLGLHDRTLSGVGHQRIGALQIRWGRVVFGDVFTSPQAGGPYLFEQPFPTAAFVCLLSLSTVGAGTNRVNGSVALKTLDVNGFTVVMSEWNTTEVTDYRIDYIALGV